MNYCLNHKELNGRRGEGENGRRGEWEKMRKGDIDGSSFFPDEL